MALYALLVGIDAYEDPVARLRGARRDVESAREFLSTTAQGGFHPRVLRDSGATRSAVIAAFREHLGAAGRGDAALFWFSGHGSLARVPKRFAQLEPTGMMQTMLCVDSRHDGVPDLLDKELSILIGEVAARGAHVAAVLDCCHADGATRGQSVPDRPEPGPRGLGARWQPPADAPLDADLLLPELRDLLAVPGGADPGLFFPAEHVSLAACHSNQVAYEVPTGDGHRGVFSLMLLRALGDGGATYRELLARTRCLVETRIPGQCPVLYPTAGTLADRPFLGGRVSRPRSALTVRFSRGAWQVDAGACHGIVAGPPGDPTRLGVHGDALRRQFRVTGVLPDRSLVEPVGWEPATGEHYPVVLARVPVPAAAVELGTGPEDARQVELLRRAIDRAGPGRGPSPYVTAADPADPGTPPELRVLRAGPGTVRISGLDGSPLGPEAPCGTAEQAARMVADLEHIVRWRRIKDLRNPGSPLNQAVSIEVVEALPGERVDPLDRAPLPAERTGAVRVRYRRDAGGWKNPRTFIRVRNRTDRQLYCVLLDLTDRYRMHPDLLPGTWIAPHGCACALDGGVVDLTLPPGRPVAEGASGTDWLKVLVAEEPIGSELFRLPRLGEQTRRAAPPAVFGGVLDRLGFAALFRDLDAPPPVARDWGTAILPVMTHVSGG